MSGHKHVEFELFGQVSIKRQENTLNSTGGFVRMPIKVWRRRLWLKLCVACSLWAAVAVVIALVQHARTESKAENTGGGIN